MNTLQWSAALRLDFEPMDAMHQAFVERLSLAQDASDQSLEQAWAALIALAENQFACEDEWIRSTALAAAEQHMLQHRVVLKVLREGLALARSGQTASVREMAAELAAWFVRHTQTQDAALALHLRRQPLPASRSGPG